MEYYSAIKKNTFESVLMRWMKQKYMSYNFMAASPSAVILEPREIKSATLSTVSSSICHEVMGPDAMIFVF